MSSIQVLSNLFFLIVCKSRTRINETYIHDILTTKKREFSVLLLGKIKIKHFHQFVY